MALNCKIGQRSHRLMINCALQLPCFNELILPFPDFRIGSWIDVIVDRIEMLGNLFYRAIQFGEDSQKVRRRD